MAISTPSRSSGSPVRHIRRLLAARSAGVVVVWLFATFNVLTGVWLLLSSLKNADEIFSTPWQLPHAAQWGNYARAWTTGLFGQAAFNTVVVVGGTAVVTLILAAPAAYALSRITTRFNGGFTLFFALGLGIPAQVVMLPLFVVMNKLFLVDSLFGLVVVYVATSLPFAVFFLTGFMSTLPVELEEAAALDGASPFRTFWQVMLPLARGGMVTVLILNIIQHWGETVFALIFIQNTQNQTLSLALLGFLQQMQFNGADWGGLFAGVTIVVLPVLACYIWLGRRIIEGMTLGSVK
ncbi:carbohydrate ABC transporter permease [Streptomyces sp. NBC_01201]|uniref:carbohydrate ABC transporter permease n=1 Tax=unclassified Streptomyces TaxID=2593676 RepID=UPI0011C7924D|nr:MULTISPECIES: carbohydrate ABC transporter permease [unclassified Streptomyces]TXS06885.1 carbohydrate ABC transporter permease [Streptomyces sp. wa22]WSQ83849.1 carbohydrate ABC transporter permease [Streptomyces sp. NBC_01212]WSR10205.1 carbohydrate ABC transporter permease [Streptomyces sp. NBC_01208]WSR47097.1 carbohydrate ABC transporter permease [Streptomyces sp. NBC_01201]